MSECEQRLRNHEIKTVGYLTAKGNYNAGFRAGFRNALEWIYVRMTGEDLSKVRDIINEELADDSPDDS